MGFIVPPAATDPAIVAKLNDAIEQALHEPAVAERLSKVGFDVIFNSAAEAKTMFKLETQNWGEMVKAADLRIE